MQIILKDQPRSFYIFAGLLLFLGLLLLIVSSRVEVVHILLKGHNYGKLFSSSSYTNQMPNLRPEDNLFFSYEGGQSYYSGDRLYFHEDATLTFSKSGKPIKVQAQTLFPMAEKLLFRVYSKNGEAKDVSTQVQNALKISRTGAEPKKFNEIEYEREEKKSAASDIKDENGELKPMEEKKPRTEKVALLYSKPGSLYLGGYGKCLEKCRAIIKCPNSVKDEAFEYKKGASIDVYFKVNPNEQITCQLKVENGSESKWREFQAIPANRASLDQLLTQGWDVQFSN